MRYEHDIEDLFDTITSYVCTSREQIAGLLSWDITKVDGVLTTIRQPDIASYFGWTVPHVPRGRGDHLFQAVLLDGSDPLTLDEEEHVRAGARSTLSEIATKSENQAVALRASAPGLPAKLARRLRNVAKIQDGVATMARDILENSF